MAAAPTSVAPSTDGVDVVVHHLTVTAAKPGGRERSSGTGPTVLAAHATGFCGPVWTPFAGHLATAIGATVVAPDLRGHGRTVLPAGVTLDWDGFADDVLATVDALASTAGASTTGAGDIVGVGHSKGGAALLRAEARRPGTFAALWCFEPVVFPPEYARGRFEDNPLAAGALRRRDVFASRAEAEANFAAKPPMADFDPRVLAAYVAGGFAPLDPDDPDGAVQLRCRPEIEAETYRMGTAHNTFEFLHEVRCPVVIAAGAAEPPGPGNFAPALAEALPDGRLASYPDLGHFGPLTDPDRIATDVIAFLSATGTLGSLERQ